jgi:hypothetical protein
VQSGPQGAVGVGLPGRRQAVGTGRPARTRQRRLSTLPHSGEVQAVPRPPRPRPSMGTQRNIYDLHVISLRKPIILSLCPIELFFCFVIRHSLVYFATVQSFHPLILNLCTVFRLYRVTVCRQYRITFRQYRILRKS